MAKAQEEQDFLTQPRRIPMTYLHIHDQGLPKRAVGERRSDCVTADNIDDALRAHGLPAAAQAMAHQHVDLAVALRVLSHPARRRASAPAVIAASPVQPARSHSAAPDDFFAIPA
jgi:hypothetical protein